MTRVPWLMAGLWSAGTAAATTLAWVGAHAVSSAIGATAVPVVPPAPQPVPTRVQSGLAARTPPTARTGTAGAGVPAGRAQTFSDPGGTATVRCSAGGIELVSASPADGYRGVVEADGPTRVAIVFLGRSWSYEIDARCADGRPVVRSTLRSGPSAPPPH